VRTCAVTLVTPDKARWIAANIAKLPESAASKVIHVPVPMSAFGGKADIGQAMHKCPLLTQSGHGRLRIVAVQTCHLQER